MREIKGSKIDTGTIAIWLIILVSAVLHFYNLGTLSFSNDELSSLVRIRYDSFHEMILKGVYVDAHPAGLQTFLYYWVKLVGDGVFAVRFPFAIASLISTWLIYKIGKKWYHELAGLLAAASFGFFIFTITYTQLARMYSLGILFCLLTVYFWTDLLFSPGRKNKNRLWWAWIISMSVAMQLQYLSFLFVAVVGLSGLFFVNRKEFLKYCLGGILALLTFVPAIPIFLAQLKIGDIGGWLGAPSKYYLFNFFYELFNRSTFICLLAILFFISGIIFGKTREGMNRSRILSLLWFFISFAVAFVYSMLGHPILMYSTMLFSTPFFLLFFYSFVPEKLLSKRNTIITIILFSLIIIYDTVVAGKYYSTNHFGVFKDVAEDADTWAKKYGVKNVPVLVSATNPEYLNYYFNRMEEPPLIITNKIETPADYEKLYDVAGTSSSPYFGYIWTNSLHPWEVPGIIMNFYPYLIARRNYFNAASYLFSKQPGDSDVNTKLFSSSCDFENSFWSIDSSRTSPEEFLSGTHSQKMDVEYGATFRKEISEIPKSGYRYVTFSAWVFTAGEIGDAKMVISFDRDNKPIDYHTVLISEFKLKYNQWQPVIFSTEVPLNIIKGDVLNVYIWNPSRKIFYIDDMKVEVHEDMNPYEREER